MAMVRKCLPPGSPGSGRVVLGRSDRIRPECDGDPAKASGRAEGVGFEPMVTLPPQWFSRASMVHGLAMLLPALSVFGDDLPSKIIPRISRAFASSPGPLPRCQRAGKLAIDERRAGVCGWRRPELIAAAVWPLCGTCEILVGSTMTEAGWIKPGRRGVQRALISRSSGIHA